MTVSLRTRLVTLYVVAALSLIALVGGALTWFALASFGAMSQQAAAAVAAEATGVVNEETQGRSLKTAAGDIARRLTQPGVRVVVSGDKAGYEMPFAVSKPRDENERSLVFPQTSRIPVPAGLPADQPSQIDPRPLRLGPPLQQRHDDHLDLPFRLNILLGLHPERVKVPNGTVVIFPDSRPLQSSMGNFWKVLLPIAIAAAFGAFMLGRIITDQALRPLEETTRSLRRFASGDFTPRPVVGGGRDEIGALAAAYNDAAAQVASSFEERHRAEDRMRQFVADAGHELRTPLTVVMGFIDVLQGRAKGDSRMTEGFDIMKSESRRMRQLIDRLIRLARLEHAAVNEPRDAPFDLAETARVVVGTLGMLDGGRRVVLHAAEPVLVEADEDEMHDALANLIENALKYAPESTVDVRITAHDRDALVEVEDRGPGLTSEDQRHIFERFYRGEGRNAESEGFGLGLAIVKRTAERAGGDVGVVSAPGEGARFWLRLPLTLRAGSPVAAAAPR